MPANYRKQLKFFTAAEWVTVDVQNDLEKHTAVSSVEVERSGTAGTLTFCASSRKDLNDAVAYIKGHNVYKHHFKEP